jgi:hypothetical protein
LVPQATGRHDGAGGAALDATATAAYRRRLAEQLAARVIARVREAA